MIHDHVIIRNAYVDVFSPHPIISGNYVLRAVVKRIEHQVVDYMVYFFVYKPV